MTISEENTALRRGRRSYVHRLTVDLPKGTLSVADHIGGASMTDVTITTDHDYIGKILTATADAIRFAEREIEECPTDAAEYRAFVEEKLEHHRALNHEIAQVYLRTRPGLQVRNIALECGE
jgi:hypothetical protein